MCVCVCVTAFCPFNSFKHLIASFSPSFEDTVLAFVRVLSSLNCLLDLWASSHALSRSAHSLSNNFVQSWPLHAW